MGDGARRHGECKSVALPTLPMPRPSMPRAPDAGTLSRIDLIAARRRHRGARPRRAPCCRRAPRCGRRRRRPRRCETMTAAFRLNLTRAVAVGARRRAVPDLQHRHVRRRAAAARAGHVPRARRDARRGVPARPGRGARRRRWSGRRWASRWAFCWGPGSSDSSRRRSRDLYFVVRVRELDLDAGSLLRGVALGLGATLVGALRPGWEAASDDARVGAPALDAGGRTRAGRGPAGARGRRRHWRWARGCSVRPGRQRGVGGVRRAAGDPGRIRRSRCPWLTKGYARLAGPVAGALLGPIGRMAARGITASSQPHGRRGRRARPSPSRRRSASRRWWPRSARPSWTGWARSCRPTSTSRRRPPSSAAAAAILDDVARSPTSRRSRASSAPTGSACARSKPTGARSTSSSAASTRSAPGVYRFKEGDAETVAARRDAGQRLRQRAVQLPLRRRATATRCRFPPTRARRRIAISGVYYDYGNDLGVVLMDERTFLQLLPRPGLARASR